MFINQVSVAILISLIFHPTLSHGSSNPYNHFITDVPINCGSPDISLSSPSAVFPQHAATDRAPKPQRLVRALGRGNLAATVLISILVLINIAVFKLQEISRGGEDQDAPSETTLVGPCCRRFTLLEIQSATNSFSDKLVIGSGGFGKVYRGVIDKGEGIVAVKRLSSCSKQGEREFWTEIETLSELRHAHLVSLIGYCNELHEMILVYEYMSRGSLSDILYKTSGTAEEFPLPWEQRLRICIDAALGLDYLHRGCKPSVIHRDVKSSNILLDDNMVAKVSDFGLAKPEKVNSLQSYVTTKVKGTQGYIDPQYCNTSKLTKKTDVYAFGVVLLEVLCNRRALDLRLPEDQWSLVSWALGRIKEGESELIIDGNLKEQISPSCLKEFLSVVEKCLDYQAKQRPTMAQVLASLESVLEHQKSTAFCGNEVVKVEDAVPSIYNVTRNLDVDAKNFPRGNGESVAPDSKEGAKRKRGKNVAVATKVTNLLKRGEKSSFGHKLPTIRWPWGFFLNRRKHSLKKSEARNSLPEAELLGKRELLSLDLTVAIDGSPEDHVVEDHTAEEARRRAETTRLREAHTLKGHVESLMRLKGLDMDHIQQAYSI